MEKSIPHYFLNADELPDGFVYPEQYSARVRHDRQYGVGMVGLPPWSYMNHRGLLSFLSLSKDRYGETLVPFAKADLQDMVAYFDVGSRTAPRVIVANPWEHRYMFRIIGQFESFDSWLDFAKEYSAQYMQEKPHVIESRYWFPIGYLPYLPLMGSH